MENLETVKADELVHAFFGGDARRFFSSTWQEHPLIIGDPERVIRMVEKFLPTTSNGGLERVLRTAPSPSTGCPSHALLLRSGESADRSRYASWSHAFCDGFSVVVNRVDYLDDGLRGLCRCLAAATGLPHCYANLYVTPAWHKAVPAHADDRDVLIVQIEGRKQWRVYNDPPVPWPYSHEQAGKDSPLGRLGPIAIEATLERGHALYIPRGFVHEARAESLSSVHATLALATHDWSWAAVAADAVKRALDTETTWRKALPFRVGGNDNAFQDGVHYPTKVALEEDCSESLAKLRDAAIAALEPRAMSHELANRVGVQWQRDDAAIERIRKIMFQNTRKISLCLATVLRRTPRPVSTSDFWALAQQTPPVAAGLEFVLQQLSLKNLRVADLQLPADFDQADALERVSLVDIGILLDLLETVDDAPVHLKHTS